MLLICLVGWLWNERRVRVSDDSNFVIGKKRTWKYLLCSLSKLDLFRTYPYESYQLCIAFLLQQQQPCIIMSHRTTSNLPPKKVETSDYQWSSRTSPIIFGRPLEDAKGLSVVHGHPRYILH